LENWSFSLGRKEIRFAALNPFQHNHASELLSSIDLDPTSDNRNNRVGLHYEISDDLNRFSII
jgi:hypothetical protein